MADFKVGRIAAFFVALAAGLILPLQVGFNTTFSKGVGSSLAGSLTSYTWGTLLLAILNAFRLLGKADWKNLRRMPRWAFAAGFVGAYYVTVVIIVAPETGLAPTSATVIAGQMLGSLLVDKLGAFGLQKKEIGLLQWFGAALLPLATALVLGMADGPGWQIQGNYLFLLLSFTAGLILSLSVGMNTTVNRYLKNPGAAALFNFLTGSLMLLAFAVAAYSSGLAVLDLSHLGTNLGRLPFWAWLGGALGAVYVTSVTVAGPEIGAALTNVLLVAGQLAMSLLLDTTGLFVDKAHPLTVYKLLGVILLVAVVIIIKSAPVKQPLLQSSAN